MLGRTYYHEILRKSIIAFGTLFNDIHIVRTDASGTAQQSMKVPLAYGPKQKFLVRLREDAALDKKIAVSLPRIGFELSGVEYDSTRKLNKMIKTKKLKDTKAKQMDTQFSPVPYNVNFEMFVMAKNSDDGVQIVEQILPYFQPDFTVTINAIPSMDIIRDIPIVLMSTNYEDVYDGDFMTRRSIVYTFNFTAKTYMYGPVVSQSMVQKVTTDQYADMPAKVPPRVRQFTATAVETSTALDDDNFGFNESLSEWVT
jgi:hypothetical protein